MFLFRPTGLHHPTHPYFYLPVHRLDYFSITVRCSTESAQNSSEILIIIHEFIVLSSWPIQHPLKSLICLSTCYPECRVLMARILFILEERTLRVFSPSMSTWQLMKILPML